MLAQENFSRSICLPFLLLMVVSSTTIADVVVYDNDAGGPAGINNGFQSDPDTG